MFYVKIFVRFFTSIYSFIITLQYAHCKLVQLHVLFYNLRPTGPSKCQYKNCRLWFASV